LLLLTSHVKQRRLMELANSRLGRFIIANEETITLTFEEKMNFFRKIHFAE